MKYIFLILIILGFSGTALALVATQNIVLVDSSAFRQYKDIIPPSLIVPTVVEVPFVERFANTFDFLVLDTETNAPVPYLVVKKAKTNQPSISLIVGDSGILGNSMIDGDTDTFHEFSLPENGRGAVSLVLKGENPLTLSGLTLLLDNYVALPTSIEVRALISGQEMIILASTKMQNNSVVFPKTTAKEWKISLTHGQLLRIKELVLKDDDIRIENSQALRFLAQPGREYRIFFDADRAVHLETGESGNLSHDKDTRILQSVLPQSNIKYVLADTDGDGIPDINDNCVSVANSNQVDLDTNGRGDSCDDFDRDTIINSIDNCPNNPNNNQADTDADGAGDACDAEESRITEKYSWLPWAGMGFAGLVLVILLTTTMRSIAKKEEVDDESVK